jgi:formate--tetrahydrofolate ligase
MKSDLEIAQEAKLKPIGEIAEEIGIEEDEIELYGNYKAKVSLSLLKRLEGKEEGKLILVTAMTPTPYGEGKTTVSIGLSQALWRIGKRAIVTLREPSLGPVFGIKGGAAGGGYSQVVPMEDINLFFTGDFYAVSAAHNLLSAMIDNHIHQGNSLGIDVRRILWKRTMDMNDRALRKIIVGLGGVSNGFPREDGFDITPASEIMAILGLSSDYQDLKERLGRIVIGFTRDRKPVRAKDLNAQGAMAALLRDALKPNLVQTLENTPAFIHTGPFGNIAHGTNSILAIKMALKLSEITVTEAGFGADLGGEKFLDIVCPLGGFTPNLAVVVASLRAVKHHGGADGNSLYEPNKEAVIKGSENILKHVENISQFGIPSVIALNVFPNDDRNDLDLLMKILRDKGISTVKTEVFAKGGEGGIELAEKVVEILENSNPNYKPIYSRNEPLQEKIEKIATLIYGADGVEYQGNSKRMLRNFTDMGYGDAFICMAKTQYSLSDNPKLIGRPKNFKITVREVRLSAGAGFVVPITGDIMTMPGLPKVPQAEKIDIDEEGRIMGLF